MQNSNVRKLFFTAVVFFAVNFTFGYCAKEEPALFWPAPPEEMRIAFVSQLHSPLDLGIKKGFFKKLKGIIFGEKNDILNKPLAIAVDKQKTIYACDSGSRAFYIFRQNEKQYKKITSMGKQELLSPVGVAVSKDRSEDGLIFLADSKLSRVFCLDKNGSLKFTIGEDGKFLRPTGLAVSNGKLYVVDTAAHNIYVFDLAGKFISEFGGRGKEDGRFNYPAAISSDKDGKIYVVDTLNFRVQVFDENNKFLYSLGRSGDSSGSFSRPKGVAVDSYGHIYVTDGIFDNAQIFSQAKELLLSFGSSGHEAGEFWIPSGIAIDSENYIYVADCYNQRIQIFRYVGKE